MGADDVIDLDAYCDSDPKSEESNLHNLSSSLNEARCKTSTCKIKVDIPKGEVIEIFEVNGESEEGNYMQKMDVEDDLAQRHVLQPNVELVEPVTMAGKMNKVEVGQDRDGDSTVTLSNCVVSNLLVDESPISGVKRARVEHVDQQPFVRVFYSSLTRESKKKLMELMQQWSEWHAQCQSSSNGPSKETLEYGEETYFPALHVGSEKTSTVSFWLDNQSRKEDIKEYRLENHSVPLYDRGCTLGSTLADGSSDPERIRTLEASRCFNCGSYSHSMKECTKPRDNVAINNARKLHQSKRNQTSGSRAPARYYQKTLGKFDDLRAGVLGPETRESLGIGEFDPPPWLQRMREMGYPPGYLDVVEDEDQPSGITIFGDEEKVEYEEGELPEKDEPQPPEKKMTVEFPGINAPIPENADRRSWAAAPAGFSGSNSFKNRSHPRSSRPPELQRGSYHEQRWSTDHRDDGPPGAEYSAGASMPGYSPRYSPYDHNQMPRSSSLVRSHSDRGEWRSPLPYESSPVHSPHSPYPYPSLPRQSPQYPSHDRWSHESPYSENSDVSSQYSRDRHDHLSQHSSDRHDHLSQHSRDRHDHRRHHRK